jgi:hypothetical protein
LSEFSQPAPAVYDTSQEDHWGVTPTSALGGILTGLLDGGVIALVVLLGVFLTGKWRRSAPVVHPVAEDLPRRRAPRVREGELPPH